HPQNIHEAMMTDLLHDLRLALRGLLRKPGFTAVAVLTLGRGARARRARLRRLLPVGSWRPPSTAGGGAGAARSRASLRSLLPAVRLRSPGAGDGGERAS